jgi:RNA polymerase sigma-70 factor (ECF subfamily)
MATRFEAETQDLVARARDRDPAAREELLRRLRPGLLNRVEVMMGAEARRFAESHDIVQSVIVDVIRDLHKFTPGRPGSLLRWACQIARHHICDEVRRKHERAFESLTVDSCSLAAVARGTSPSGLVNLEERKERVADALACLSDEYRKIVRLRYFERLKFSAIAKEMGRTENAVLMLHSRALLRLGALLQELDESNAP